MINQLSKKLISLLFFLIISSNISGIERGSSTTISFGGYLVSSSDSTISGSQLAVSYRHPFSDETDYLLRLSSEEAAGFKSETDGSKSEMTAGSTTLKGGVQINFFLEELKNSLPFIQGGLSVLSYKYDYTNQGSEIGSAQGIGYGFFGSIGINFRVGAKTRILPAYHYNQSYIAAENGNTTVVISSGITFALIVSY